MKSRTTLLWAGASLFVAVSTPSGIVLAQSTTAATTPEQVMAIKGAGNTDPTGATGPLSAEGKALAKAPTARQPQAATMYACLEMLYDGNGPVMWTIDAEVGPSGNIVSAKVSGGICESPNWSLSGTLGGAAPFQENIVGTRTNPSVDPNCNKSITIKGALAGFIDWVGPNPPTGIGKTSGYNFPSMGPNQWFPQTTYLKSYSPTHLTCP